MFYDFTVEIPEVQSKIYTKIIKGVTYINYEYDRIYKPEKKYNIPKRTTIGKQCADNPGFMFPNPNFMKFFPDAPLPMDKGKEQRSSCLRIGTHIVLQKIIQESGIVPILERIYDERGTGLFLDIAAYSLVTENNAGQYYPDYAYNHPLFTPKDRIYSDSTVSDFINQINMDEIVTFQNEWNATKDHRDKIYISYDSTNKNCQAGDIDFLEYGHAKEDKGLPIFNYSIAYDVKNRDPLFYEEYPGSIVDVSQLQYMLDKAKGYGYKHAGFILDRGYFSEANIGFMDQCGYEFIIMARGMKAFISQQVLSEKDTFENNRSHFIKHYGVNGTTVKKKMFSSDMKERYIHVYYSASKCASERMAFEKTLDKMEQYMEKMQGKATILDKSFERHFNLEYVRHGKKEVRFIQGTPKDDIIERELKLCGYFCIITSEEMTAKEALELYKSRDVSEKLFRADKTFLGNRSPRVHSEESLRGKMLMEFAALIFRNRMFSQIKDARMKMDERPNYMNVPAAIRELEKIEMIRQGDGVYRLDHAITATQKKILHAFGMDVAYVKSKAKEISERLDLRYRK
jgi:Transposase